jgi:hypothetical protein
MAADRNAIRPMTSRGLDNPWESAALDRQYEIDQQRLLNPEYAQPPSTASSPVAQSSSALSLSAMGNQALPLLHLADAVFGILVLVYAIYLQHKSQGDSRPDKHDNVEQVVSWTASAVLVLRSLCGLTATQCGLWMSGTLSSLLGVTEFVLSMTTLAMTKRGTLERYLVNHDPLLYILHKYPQAIWSVFLGCAVLEWIRWALIQHVVLAARLASDPNANLTALHGASPGGALGSNNQSAFYHQRRPWWWNSKDHNANLSESLLERGSGGDPHHWTSPGAQGYHISDGVAGGGSSIFRWPWSSPINARDDASVDYASLNEDWASRSQEDPLWWTKDDEERQQKVSTKQTSTTMANSTTNSGTSQNTDWAERAERGV